MTDLAVRSTVAELVAAFRQAEAVVRTSFAAIVEAERCLNGVFALGESSANIRIDASRHGYHDSFDDPSFCIDRLKRAAWATIVGRLEIRRMCSVAKWKEIEDTIDKGDLPDLTEENVNAFARDWSAALPDMLTEAVTEVFEWLRPHHSEYKTNTELEIGRRVILSGMVERHWMGKGYRVNYHRTQQLSALESVMGAIDGKGAINKTYQSALQTAIESSGVEGKGETALFRFRAYRNHNLHLEFKRADLLEKLNRIAGGNRLRPGRAA